MSEPRYDHDGDASCTFLGQRDGADLYFCPQGGFPTVIARYSSEPSDYMSGLYAAPFLPDLAAARTLAVERGLLPAEAP